ASFNGCVTLTAEVVSAVIGPVLTQSKQHCSSSHKSGPSPAARQQVDDLRDLAWTSNCSQRTRRYSSSLCGLMRWLAIGLGTARMHLLPATMPLAIQGMVRAIDGFDCGRILHKSDGRPHSPSR